MDLRGVASMGAKDAAPMIQKAHSERKSKEVKPFAVTGSKNGVMKMVSLVSLRM